MISTAAIPGKRAPVLITDAMVASMKPGAVIVDLAAETGGNCALTKPGETIRHPTASPSSARSNLPATVPLHASQMFSRNVLTLLQHLIKDGQVVIDSERRDHRPDVRRARRSGAELMCMTTEALDHRHCDLHVGDVPRASS